MCEREREREKERERERGTEREREREREHVCVYKCVCSPVHKRPGTVMAGDVRLRGEEDWRKR